MSKLTFVAKSALEMSVTTSTGGVVLSLEEALGVQVQIEREIFRMRKLAEVATAAAAAAAAAQKSDGIEGAAESLRP